MMKKVTSFLAISTAAVCLYAGQSFAASTAAEGMHYGKSVMSQSLIKSQDDGAPIVVTNCSYDNVNLSAQFMSDGSYNDMPMGPAGSGTDIVTLGDNSQPGHGTNPYVNITVTDNGVVLYSQPTYPGANVDIGCGTAKLTNGKHPVVTVSQH